MFFPLSLPSQAVNIGSNSLSSSCSGPHGGAAESDGGILADLLRRELRGSNHRHFGALLPLALGHRHGHGLGVSVPLQYTTATLLIRLNDLSFWICYGRNINQLR